MAGRPLDAFAGRQHGAVIFHGGDGYFYNLREVRNSRARLRCRLYRKSGLGCFGTANVSFATNLLVHSRPHNHEPDPLLEEDFELRRNMIQEAGNNVFGKKIQTLLNEWKIRTPNVDLASRFTTARMKSALYLARSRNYPKIPNTLLHLGLLLTNDNMRPICLTVDGNDLIFRGVIGSPHDKTLSLVFASGRMLQFLQDRPNLHSDGTFRKRSKKPQMAQIFNIVTKYGQNIVCCVRVLMTSRTTDAYKTVLAHLLTLAPNLNPEVIHCDFELGQMRAWQSLFPAARIAGCLWHYAVAFSSKARELGLTPHVQEDEFVLKSIASLCAIPMLPSHLMWRGVEEIWLEIQARGWHFEFRPLLKYFQTYWYPRKEELCVYGVPDRTNNCSESDNRAIASVIPQNRPNIYHLIGGFVQLEHLAWCDKISIDRLQVITGGRKWKAVLNDRTVRLAVSMLDDGHITIAQFLHRTSYAIMAAVKHGLRLHKKKGNQDSEEDSEGDSEEDSEGDSEEDSEGDSEEESEGDSEEDSEDESD